MPRRQEGSFPSKNSGGKPEDPKRWIARPLSACSPLRVDWSAHSLALPTPNPVSMESVVSCCDNSRSGHEGLAKHLTLSLCAQLLGRTMG